MSELTQIDLLPALLRGAELNTSAAWLIRLLEGRTTWTTASDILREAGLEVSEDNKRWLRRLRRLCVGRVIGGPGASGYRRTDTLTKEEYDHWRATMLGQADEMRSGVIEADKIWYARQAA